MSANIEGKLAQLELMYAKRDFLDFQKRQLRNEIITPEIQQQLDDLEAEFAPNFAAINEAIGMAEADIKDDIQELKATVAIDTMQAIYRKGPKKWDTKGLEKYAEDHPEVQAFKKTGKPSVIIQARKVQG